MGEPFAVDDTGATTELPNALPTLVRGTHQENDRECSPMEAACWLNCEPWSLCPSSVHPVISAEANAASERLDTATHQELWPLVLASIGTRRRFRFVLTWRMRHIARRSRATTGDQLLALWSQLLDESEQRSKRGRIRRLVGRIARKAFPDGRALGVPFFY